MVTYFNINDLILVDELVNDFEFSEHLYGSDFSNTFKKETTNSLFWADMQ